MSLFASSIINTEVKYSCSSTATEDVASAQDVFAFYCSAASNLVKAVGVTESVAQTYPTAKAGTGSGAGGSQPTSGAGSDGKDRSRSPSNALIAGAVGGVIAVLGLIGIAIFLVRKKAKERREREQQAQVLNDLSGNPPNNGGLGVPSTGQQAPFGQHPNSPPPDYYGKAELPSSNSTGIAAAAAIGKPPPSPAPSNGGATRPHTSGGATTGGNVSPVSAYSTLNNNGLPNHPELPATNVPPVPYPPNQAELAGGVPAGGHPSATSPSNHQYNSPYAPPPPPNRAELPPGQPTYNQPPLFTAYGHPQPPPAVAGAAEMYAGPPGTAVHEVPGSSGYPQPPQQAWGGYQQPGAQPQQQHEWGGQQQYNQGRPQWQQPWQQHQRIYEAPNTTATGYGDRPAELQGAMGYQSGPVPQSYTAELDGWGSGRNGGSGVAYAR